MKTKLNFLFVALLAVAFFPACKRAPHYVTISIVNPYNDTIEKSFKVKSDSLFLLKGKTENLGMNLLVDSLGQADSITFSVKRPVDFFGDGFITYNVDVYASGKHFDYYHAKFHAICSDSSKIVSPELLAAPTLDWDINDRIDISNTLNHSIKNGITKQAFALKIEKHKVKIICVNAVTGDTTDWNTFTEDIIKAAKAKEKANK